MTTFFQIHMLTQYPPANLNRDDTGRPKTAIFGGAPRLRISSQALKRAWRTSEKFKTALSGHIGERTQRLGEIIEQHLREHGMNGDDAKEGARDIANLFGKLKKPDDKHPTQIEQLAFISPEERATAWQLAGRMAAGEEIDLAKTPVLRQADSAVDIAMFGRMLADKPDFSREASVQVAHAITTHKTIVEDDYYTAVDDLKKPSEDAGAGFIGDLGFAAGLFYLYICVDFDLLNRNLGGDRDLATLGLKTLLHAAATEGPRGKQASFASRARASYIMVEKGETTPRTLAAAFANPVTDGDLLQASVDKLGQLRTNFSQCYGDTTACCTMNAATGEGSIDELKTFLAV